MCIELCSSCFYVSKAFVKPKAINQSISPSHAIDLLGPKLIPFASENALCLVSSQLTSSSLVVNVHVTAYGSVFFKSSQLLLTMHSSLIFISNLTHMVPFSQSNSALVRVIKAHRLSSAKLVAQVIKYALAKRIHLGSLMSQWCI